MQFLSVVGVQIWAFGILEFALCDIGSGPFGFAIELYLGFQLLVLGFQYPYLFFELFDNFLQSLRLLFVVLLLVNCLVSLSQILGGGLVRFRTVQLFDWGN